MIFKDIIDEGIDVDPGRRTISFNSDHERIINTSVHDNPTRDDGFSIKFEPGITQIKNAEVWSVFKRVKSNDIIDSNHLIYALKGEHGWKFRTNKDRDTIISCIEDIVEKFAKTHTYHTVVIVPSTKPVNEIVASIAVRKLKGSIFIKSLFAKLSVQEVYNKITEDGSAFKKRFKGHLFYDKLNIFNNCMRALVGRRDPESVPFVLHRITDPDVRNAIDSTLRVSDPKLYHGDIDGKDVLLIDDIISRGTSIKDSINTMMTCYKPSSITVLSLISRR